MQADDTSESPGILAGPSDLGNERNGDRDLLEEELASDHVKVVQWVSGHEADASGADISDLRLDLVSAPGGRSQRLELGNPRGGREGMAWMMPSVFAVPRSHSWAGYFGVRAEAILQSE